ncbi:MAG: hypothetical protein PHE89_00375 [Alphaproteobacteria bacterium]|nr:hypothetical protein [Alphaproteobacteria bacterium]
MSAQLKINELKERSLEVRQLAKASVPYLLHAQTRQEASSPQKIIENALEREFKQIGEGAKRDVARELVTMPHGRKVKIGGEVINVEDLQYRIAESIDIYNAGTSRKYEYHEYIDDASKIIRDMNTDGVIPDELTERNAFIDDTIQRENEILTCLGLYRASKFEGAQEKYKELYTRLQKIREVRSAILSSTKSTADKFEEENKRIENEKKLSEEQKRREQENVKVNPSKADKALAAAMVFTLMNYDKLVPERKKEAGIYHGDLEQKLAPEKCYDWLVNQSRGQTMLEGRMMAKHQERESIELHLLSLSGVRLAKYGNLEKPVERRHQEFDRSRFNAIFNRYEEERLRA